MHNTMKLALQVICAGVVMSSFVRAEDTLPAPTNTFELSLAGGYGQGLGPVAGDAPRLQDLGSAGGTVQLTAGWRFDPQWEAGIYGELGYFGSGNVPGSDHALSAAAGIQGQFHLLPALRYDPWVGLGVGWRGYWGRVSGSDYGLQGIDLVRLQAGVDYRLTSHFAVGPVAGITVTEFLSKEPIGASGYSDTHDRKLDTFVFAGIGGRFEL